mmetsp:Transcript_19643/g.30295  ORF Transcript_19643/g.30295 Transcript_19643/m.30295 type:complete len:201 (-) Transcript_19643:1586-2188(-)
MIFGEKENLLASIDRHDSSAVSDVAHVAQVPHDQDNDGTRTTSLHEIFFGLALLVSPLEEHLLGFGDSVLDGYFWVAWEVLVTHYELVELVSQEISASGASVAIVDCEEGAPGPLLHLLELRLNDVEDNGDSVFVVVTNDTLVSISCIATNHPVLLASELGWVVGLNEAINLFLLHLHVLLLLLYRHDESAILRQGVLAL